MRLVHSFRSNKCITWQDENVLVHIKDRFYVIKLPVLRLQLNVLFLLFGIKTYD